MCNHTCADDSYTNKPMCGLCDRSKQPRRRRDCIFRRLRNSSNWRWATSIGRFSCGLIEARMTVFGLPALLGLVGLSIASNPTLRVANLGLLHTQERLRPEGLSAAALTTVLPRAAIHSMFGTACKSATFGRRSALSIPNSCA